MRAILILLLSSTAALADVALQWNASTDASGIQGYKIYRDGVQVGFSPTTSYVDTTAAPGTQYSYAVSAVDNNNNESARTSGVIVNSLLAAFPNASNTGIPAGTVLTNYTGPCTITVANTVIDAKTVSCVLSIKTTGVIISRSKINGLVVIDENDVGFSFLIRDSEIDGGNSQGTVVGARDYTALRNHIYNGNRSMHCWLNAVIQDNYVHGQFTDSSGTFHESGIRMGDGCTIRHNTITCDAPDVPPDGGCSAGLTGYGDFATVQNNTIDRNKFLATTGGFCAYGGSSASKPFPNANNIRFTNNVFDKRTVAPTNFCGVFGTVTDYNPAAAGNVFTNNKYSDGTDVIP